MGRRRRNIDLSRDVADAKLRAKYAHALAAQTNIASYVGLGATLYSEYDLSIRFNRSSGRNALEILSAGYCYRAWRAICISKAHFIGIAGKGMSATALLLKQRAVDVSDSDEGFYPPVSDYLKSANVAFAEGYGRRTYQTMSIVIIIGKNAKLQRWRAGRFLDDPASWHPQRREHYQCQRNAYSIILSMRSVSGPAEQPHSR